MMNRSNMGKQMTGGTRKKSPSGSGPKKGTGKASVMKRGPGFAKGGKPGKKC